MMFQALEKIPYGFLYNCSPKIPAGGGSDDDNGGDDDKHSYF
jgi:hypothetical protein